MQNIIYVNKKDKIMNFCDSQFVIECFVKSSNKNEPIKKDQIIKVLSKLLDGQKMEVNAYEFKLIFTH